jgi:hypothetical protein
MFRLRWPRQERQRDLRPEHRQGKASFRLARRSSRVGLAQGRQPCRTSPDDEPFAFGCGAQAVVTADKFEGRRAAFGGHEGGSQLKGVGRAKIVVLGNPQAVGRAFRPA